jgi:lysophospholipase L1-like esterase
MPTDASGEPEVRIEASIDRGAPVEDAASNDADGATEAAADAEASVSDAELSDRNDGGTSPLELVHHYGRWERLADRAVTVNSGSHLVAQFEGTAVAARFDVSANRAPLPTLAWRIDQGPWQEGEVAASVTLAQGLAPGVHELSLMARGFDENQSRWTPPLASSLTFLSFDVTGGALRASPRPVRRKIEFLGDSITEGVAVFADRAGKAGPSWRADGRIAYACQTAILLDAEWRQVGFGRQGVTIVGNGGVPKAGDSFDWIHAGTPRDAWQPDLVVINQGTNDGSAASNVFRPAYTGYLTIVRKGYPQSLIAALRPFGGAHAADIQAEVAARVAAGDDRIFYVDTTGWLSGPDFTDGVHPNTQGSGKAAQLLVTELRKHLP